VTEQAEPECIDARQEQMCQHLQQEHIKTIALFMQVPAQAVEEAVQWTSQMTIKSTLVVSGIVALFLARMEQNRTEEK
jgi:NADPH-dependent curcumin reductase CurA